MLRADARPSSFVFNANAASSLRLWIVKPFESSPDLTSVVFARCENSIAGVIESAREKLVVMPGKNLSAKTVIRFFIEMPKSRCFICN